MHRTVSLLTVAGNFCTAFAQMPDISAFLSTDKRSLHAVCKIATLFRTLALEHAAGPEAETRADAQDCILSRVRLNDLQPSASKKAQSLNRVVRMTSETFNKICRPRTPMADPSSMTLEDQELNKMGGTSSVHDAELNWDCDLDGDLFSGGGAEI